MTVQTFEEYADNRATLDPRWKNWREWQNTEKNNARLLFADGMRNAAEVCDDKADLYRSGFHYSREAMITTAETCATRIREAARGG